MFKKEDLALKIYYPEDILEKSRSMLTEDIVCVTGQIVMDKNFVKIAHKDRSITLEGLPDEEVIEEICNKRVNVIGYLYYYVHTNGGIYPRLKVNYIEVISENQDENVIKSTLKEINEILKNKQPFGFSDYFVSLVKQNIIPIKIALIHGTGAQVQQDFRNGIRRSFVTNIPLEKVLLINTYETVLSNDESLASTILDIINSDEEVDAIYILRGGGSEEELSRIGGPKTAKVIAKLGIPVYLALGHSMDKPNKLLAKVISDEFPTPSIAGTELGSVLNLAIENILHKQEIKDKSIEIGSEQNKVSELQKQNMLLSEELNKTKKKMIFSWIIIFIAIILLKILKIL